MNGAPTLVEVPEGVKIIGVATEDGRGYRIEGGAIYGSPTHPYGPGALVIEPADGYEFHYDAMHDATFPSKKVNKMITITMHVTNEHDRNRLRTAAPLWPGFVAIIEAEVKE